MATILLTDEEYQHIQNLREDLINRIASSTPRAATHYNAIAKQCSKFIARENGKRAESQEKANDRQRLQEQNEARRANNASGRQNISTYPGTQSA